jgi:hypothetical protein
VLDNHLAPASRLGSAQLIAPDHLGIRVVSTDGLHPPVGALVRIIASLDPGATVGRVDAATAVVADAARVLAVDGGTDGRDLGVLVEVRSEEAPRVAFAAANGALTLALLPPEDACCVDEQPSPPPPSSSEPAA